MGPTNTASATDKLPLRILVLSGVEPFPLRSGWQTVVYNDIKFLAARGHEITLLAITHERSASPRDVADIAKAEYFYRCKLPHWWYVLANTGKSLPYTVVRRYDARLLRRASELICSGDVDILLVEETVMGPYARLLNKVQSVPTYFKGHNIITTIAKRYYKSQRNPILRFLGWRQYVKFARYEGVVMDDYHGVCQISPVDAAEIERMNPRVKSHVVYSGVDVDYFSFAPPEAREADTITHVGSLDLTNKLPGMLWFYKKVLPRIRERRPHVRLELVGRMPQCVLHQADANEVVLHGVVPDVRPYLAKGAVFVAPQFVGSGIRVKILNALATGNAVVATSVACEGLPVTHGKNILIADEEGAFAEYVYGLLEDPALREKMGREGRLLVEERFRWPQIAQELEGHLREAIARHAASA